MNGFRILLIIVLLVVFVDSSDWPQNNHDSGSTRNIDNDPMVDLAGLWYRPFQKTMTTLSKTAWTFQPVVSAIGGLFYPGPNVYTLTCEDIFQPKDSPTRVMWILDLTQTPFYPLIKDQETFMPATLALSLDQSVLYSMYVYNSSFVLFGVGAVTGDIKWWTIGNNTVMGDFVLHSSTATSPFGWITIPLDMYIDVFIPPMSFDKGYIEYTSHVRSRQTIDYVGKYSTPLGLNGKLHTLLPINSTLSRYIIFDEFNAVIASMDIMGGGKLVMVTSSNTGVISDGLSTTLIFLDPATNVLSARTEMDLKPASFVTSIGTPMNLPFMLFIHKDRVQGTAFYQYSPEPAFDQAVVWTTPADNDNFSMTEFAVSTDASSFLDGVIYVRTSNGFLRAVQVHNGQLLWETPLMASPTGLSAPVLANLDHQGLSRYVLLATTQDEYGNPSFVEFGCCSGNGYCNIITVGGRKVIPQTCSCFPNYFGDACGTFCNVALCEGTTKANGTCTAAGCTCNPDHYGLNCEILCIPSTTCNGHGQCVNNTGACLCNGAGLTDIIIYKGANCEMHTYNYLLIGTIAGGGGFAVVLIIVIILVLVCTKKRKRTKNKYDAINN